MILLVPTRYGPDSASRLQEATAATPDGARAALESFYYALNNQDAGTLAQAWAAHDLAQLNNPVGGVLRGGEAIVGLYRRIFAGPVRLQVTFTDVVEYLGPEHAVFAGRELGSYTVGDGEPVALQIRTSRYLRFEGGRWQQFHHHGSIDDPQELDAYQRAIAG